MQDLVDEILAAWQQAERLAEDCHPGSERQIELLAAAESARVLYTQLTLDVDRVASFAPRDDDAR